MKNSILKTMGKWFNEKKEPKVKKTDFKAAFYDSTETFNYKIWFNENNG